MTVLWQGPAWLERPAAALGLGNSCRRATSLTLEGPLFEDRCAPRIAQLQHLRTLTLYGTRISDQGIAAIQQKLPKCRIQRDPPASQAVDWASWGMKVSSN